MNTNTAAQRTAVPTKGTDTSEEDFDRNFKPKGAIAFFVLLVILGAIIWYGIYFLMLSRA